MTITATAKSASADSYVTTAEYGTYGGNMAWDLQHETVEELIEADLRRAQQYLDRSFTWYGTRTSTTQALAWPRVLGRTVDSITIDSDTVPQAIKDAQCEVAYLFDQGIDLFDPTDDVRAHAAAIEGLLAPYGARHGTALRLLRA